MTDSSNPTGLRDYLRVLRQRWLLIVPITLLVGGAALVYSLNAEPVYRAQAALQFQEPSAEIDALGGGTGSRLQPEERAAIGADLVTRPDIRRAVRRDLHRSTVGASYSASIESRSNLVTIRAESSSPRRAAEVANSVARQTNLILRRRYRREVGRQLRAARPDIEKVGKLRDPVVRADQLRLLATLKALRKLGAPVEIVRRASVPSAKLSPRPVRNTLLGLLAGLTLGLVAAFARDALDRRVRASGDIADSAALPVLGHTRANALGRIKPPGSGKRKDEADLDAIRIVRANLEFLDFEHPPARVLVTSALPEEGKSTVAASLAMANSLAGKSTLLVECDLRRPVIAGRLGLDQVPGLSDYLAGRASLEQVVQTVVLGGGASSNGDAPNGQEPGRETLLGVITSGSPAPRSAELLGSPRFAEFARAASESYDTVVLDSSPILPVADTLELVEHVDRVVVCARSRRTTRDQLKAAVDALARVPGPVAGIVVTGVRKGDELDYGYYSPGRAAASVGPT